MSQSSRRAIIAIILALLFASQPIVAGYKARPWSLRVPESYPARLTSEGVTIAVEPLYKDDLAARVFDKNDIVTRGIMPLAVVIFNDNAFPIRIEGATIEIISGDEHVHTLLPSEVVHRVFQKGRSVLRSPIPLPRGSGGDDPNRDALEDFEHKFLGSKIVEAHSKAGGFLYIRPLDARDLQAYVARTRVYIPDVFRDDDGSKLIFFEVDMKPAVEGQAIK